jgi:hypothetical protein
MCVAKYPIVVTIDADMENNPSKIPFLAIQTSKFEIVVASRTRIPRISEKIASKTLGRLFKIADPFSNFRAYKKDIIPILKLKDEETFGAEFPVIAKKRA